VFGSDDTTTTTTTNTPEEVDPPKTPRPSLRFSRPSDTIYEDAEEEAAHTLTNSNVNEVLKDDESEFQSSKVHINDVNPDSLTTTEMDLCASMLENIADAQADDNMREKVHRVLLMISSRGGRMDQPRLRPSVTFGEENDDGEVFGGCLLPF
jgi:hypothetical protein